MGMSYSTQRAVFYMWLLGATLPVEKHCVCSTFVAHEQEQKGKQIAKPVETYRAVNVDSDILPLLLGTSRIVPTGLDEYSESPVPDQL
jgi:hypothetical protein